MPSAESEHTRMLTPDSQLIAAWQRGDESAFQALFERYRARVVNIAWRFLGDADAAQDAAQDVFIKLYTSARDYRPDAEFSTWLYRVTANACLDALRKRHRSRMARAIWQRCPRTSPFRRGPPQPRGRCAAIASLPRTRVMAVVLQGMRNLLQQTPPCQYERPGGESRSSGKEHSKTALLAIKARTPAAARD